jgi:hypothetical protein
MRRPPGLYAISSVDRNFPRPAAVRASPSPTGSLHAPLARPPGAQRETLRPGPRPPLALAALSRCPGSPRAYGPNTRPSLTRYTGWIEARYDRPMTTDVYPLQVLLVTLAGWINRHQQHVIEYLVEENRVLKGQLNGRRLRLTDDQRRWVCWVMSPSEFEPTGAHGKVALIPRGRNGDGLRFPIRFLFLFAEDPIGRFGEMPGGRPRRWPSGGSCTERRARKGDGRGAGARAGAWRRSPSRLRCTPISDSDRRPEPTVAGFASTRVDARRAARIRAGFLGAGEPRYVAHLERDHDGQRELRHPPPSQSAG